MASRRTEMALAAPQCLEAVKLYAREVGRQTGLKPVITALETDVVFEGDTDALAFAVEWTAAAPAGHAAPPSEWESDDAEPDEADEGPDPRIAPYEATLEALASNPEAAQALLDRWTHPESRPRRARTSSKPGKEVIHGRHPEEADVQSPRKQ